MTQRKFDRRVILTVPRKTIRHPEVRIEGVVPFSQDWVEQVATIRVFNVEDPVVDAIAEAQTLSLEAGHEGDVGVIRQGIVRTVSSETRRGDRIIEIAVGTGIRQIQETFISETIGGRVTAEDLVDRILDRLPDIERGRINFPPRSIYPNKVISMTAFEALDEIARDFNREIYLKDLELTVERPGNLSAGNRIFLNENNGLLEIPRTRTRRPDEPTFTARSILMHQIEPGQSVEIDEERVSGRFRAISGRHSLTDFQTTAVLEEPVA